MTATSPRIETARALRATRRHRSTRSIVVTGVLAGAVAVLFILTMMVGSVWLGAGEVIASVLHLADDPSVDFIVRGLRLPTAIAAVAVGLALGASGTIFQQLLRNSLASPDFVGIASGAGLAAATGIVVLQVGGLAVSALALGGAAGAALLMYLLAWRDGVTGYRFILIGIGVAACFDGLIGYVLTRAQLFEARQVMHWLTRSIGQANSSELRLLLGALAVLLPVAVLLARQLRVLELGDDTARGLGARTELSRAGLLAVAVAALVALAVSVAGPIAVVALVAGPIANRLLGPAAGGIAAAALVGAALLLTADLVAVHLLPAPLPTGVVTGAVGAPYLLWLLATTNRQGAGG